MIISDQKQLITFLKKNKVGIIPTDTIYGLVTFWKNIDGILKIYHLKKRSFTKKMPVLVASFAQLEQFIDCDQSIKEFILHLQKPTTIIFSFKKDFVKDQRMIFFDQQKIAIRFVKDKWLQQIILECGPLVATSCNVSKHQPLHYFQELKMWEDDLDFIFYDWFKKKQKPSRIIDWKTKKKIR